MHAVVDDQNRQRIRGGYIRRRRAIHAMDRRQCRRIFRRGVPTGALTSSRRTGHMSKRMQASARRCLVLRSRLTPVARPSRRAYGFLFLAGAIPSSRLTMGRPQMGHRCVPAEALTRRRSVWRMCFGGREIFQQGSDADPADDNMMRSTNGCGPSTSRRVDGVEMRRNSNRRRSTTV